MHVSELQYDKLDDLSVCDSYTSYTHTSTHLHNNYNALLSYRQKPISYLYVHHKGERILATVCMRKTTHNHMSVVPWHRTICWQIDRAPKSSYINNTVLDTHTHNCTGGRVAGLWCDCGCAQPVIYTWHYSHYNCTLKHIGIGRRPLRNCDDELIFD